MKIALIGPGIKEIPPQGWGAVESLIWDYYINLTKLNHHIVIINTPNVREIIKAVNKIKYDIVHIMYDDHIVAADRIRCGKIFYTTHFAYLTSPELKGKYKGYYDNIFKKALRVKDKIYINAISQEIKDIYVREGFPKERINVVRNGAREDKFRFDKECKFKERSIYLAKIETRKRQYLYQNIVSLYFAGNYHDSNFKTNRDNYLREWSKDFLYDNLTNYANLVLLSDGEADPLVVKEALIAGLGVVVSQVGKANLDLSKDFIDVIPNDKLNDIKYVEEIIKKNREISIKKREEIRQYALDNFSWHNIIEDYNKLLN
jgi:glycosyltransferase involved in cell wall biosynthesis